MNERTIWILRIAAIFIFLLLAYLMMDLYAKLRRMQGAGPRTNVELQIADRSRIADRGLRITGLVRTLDA